MADTVKKNASRGGTKKIIMVVCAMFLLATAVGAIITAVHLRSKNAPAIPAQKLSVFVDKFPESAQESVSLLKQKVSNVLHEKKERVSRSYVMSLREAEDETEAEKNGRALLGASLTPLLTYTVSQTEIDYGEDTSSALPDLSALPVPEDSSAECSEEGIFQLTLRYGTDGAKLLGAQESVQNMDSLIAGISAQMEVSASSMTAKEAVVYAEINGVNGILQRLDITVNYDLNLTGTVLGGTEESGEQKVVVGLKEETDCQISRAGIYFEANTYYIPLKGSHALNPALHLPEDFTDGDYKITYTSSNGRVLTVDDSGRITPLAVSKEPVTVTATLEYSKEVGVFFDVCDVYVTVPVRGVKLSAKKLSLAPGTTETITSAIAPFDATITEILWISEDETIAAVDETGKVTALSPGVTRITAVTQDGHYSAVCTVRVTES